MLLMERIVLTKETVGVFKQWLSVNLKKVCSIQNCSYLEIIDSAEAVTRDSKGFIHLINELQRPDLILAVVDYGTIVAPFYDGNAVELYDDMAIMKSNKRLIIISVYPLQGLDASEDKYTTAKINYQRRIEEQKLKDECRDPLEGYDGLCNE